MELGQAFADGRIVTSVEGGFSFQLEGEIDYVDNVTSKRDVGGLFVC